MRKVHLLVVQGVYHQFSLRGSSPDGQWTGHVSDAIKQSGHHIGDHLVAVAPGVLTALATRPRPEQVEELVRSILADPDVAEPYRERYNAEAFYPRLRAGLEALATANGEAFLAKGLQGFDVPREMASAATPLVAPTCGPNCPALRNEES